VPRERINYFSGIGDCDHISLKEVWEGLGQEEGSEEGGERREEERGRRRGKGEGRREERGERRKEEGGGGKGEEGGEKQRDFINLPIRNFLSGSRTSTKEEEGGGDEEEGEEHRLYSVFEKNSAFGLASS
jgi:hypothetical protein